ncbi:helix-turn-helix transcriptional regulator [Fulvivirga sp.]|uniref:helix-turn-helix domain-containing protein n=1 Tax=Fulvivirga sp. TaxID=1931237 RepID=UPI0032EF75B9
MKKALSIEEFYANDLKFTPDNLNSGIGHFNVFQLDEFASAKPKPMPYNRRDYYKISLVKGRARVHYADKVIEVDKQVLIFSNPQIPYNFEKIDEQLTGYFCLFTEAYFHQYGNIYSYPVFQSGGTPVFILEDEQADAFSEIYKKMFTEINSDYAFKYDALKNLVFDMIHTAMKLQPANLVTNHHSNASDRISSFFMELLERQFPIEHVNQKIKLRSASEFAEKLNVHVNHLNRALKETVQKTTTDIISDRILQEAKILLRHTNWNVAEIAESLGFEETAHFSNFFKKNTKNSPVKFRKAVVI